LRLFPSTAAPAAAVRDANIPPPEGERWGQKDYEKEKQGEKKGKEKETQEKGKRKRKRKRKRNKGGREKEKEKEKEGKKEEERKGKRKRKRTTLSLHLRTYGVATISRLLIIMGLFCRIRSLLQGSFAKETYNFREPNKRSHPTPYHKSGWVCVNLVCV